MTDVAMVRMGRTSQTRTCVQDDRPRERLKLFLRGRYRGYGATQRLAADIGDTPKAAENLLNGHWPDDLRFAAIVRCFGRDLWDAVLAPELDPVVADLRKRKRDLEEQLQQADALLRQAEGGGDGVRGRVAVPARTPRTSCDRRH